ncbi:LysR family transcriptional regulator [Pokkaliibacter plantistimulans]|uniref:LysR family transcriptional regulator n=1 Tax=Proteobacteria bacterium 228 TaxID=2083153 RepID=A0A2S5KGW1_9PROT|nr:LysR substrate-binding domain-containing protein [Pokkaliibacter plantistimulans]PPC74018.1 LysR family transcriptional regulator [Pokkaliibacter plantistimulans]
MPTLRRQLPSANALFVFEAAARCGNFTRAAAELGVTQPAVSRMLSLLEEYLGVKLFVRTPTGTELTEYGQLLNRGIREGFDCIEAAINEIHRRQSGQETVTLSVSTAFTNHWLMPRMHRLQQEFPGLDVRFQLISGSVTGPLDDVDLGVRFLSGEDIKLSGHLLMPELLTLVASPAYKEQHLHSAQDASATFISLTDSRTNWLEHFPDSREHFGTLHALEFSDYAVVLQAALLGQGVAVGWMNVVSNWLCNGALVPVTNEVIATGRQCYVAYSARKPLSTAAQRVKDWIIEETYTDLRKVIGLYPDLDIERLCHKSAVLL